MQSALTTFKKQWSTVWQIAGMSGSGIMSIVVKKPELIV